MIIDSLRLGFATNSSSTHSVVLSNGLIETPDAIEGDDYWGPSYREEFALTSPKPKMQYLASAVYSNLIGRVGPYLAGVAASMIAPPVSKNPNRMYPLNYQISDNLYLPRQWEGYGIDPLFLEDLTDYLLQKHVAIYGSREEGEGPYPEQIRVTQMVSNHWHTGNTDNAVVARKDPQGYWTLFNRANGDKMRLTFADKMPKVKRAHAPELVDLKITDYCTAGCEFCYQSSSPEGKHAEINDIHRILSELDRLHCFEVCLGGGEPLDYPRIDLILNSSTHVNINLTTNKHTFWGDRGLVKSLQRKGCAIGVSCRSEQQVETLYDNAIRNSFDISKLTVQIPMGTVHNVFGIVDAAIARGFHVLLLGYKAVGRGADYARKRHFVSYLDQILELAKLDLHIPYNVSVDTKLAKEARRQLKVAIMRRDYGDMSREAREQLESWEGQNAEEILDLLSAPNEGVYSCYVDAVNKTIGAHSYGAPMIPLTTVEQGFKEMPDV